MSIIVVVVVEAFFLSVLQRGRFFSFFNETFISSSTIEVIGIKHLSRKWWQKKAKRKTPWLKGAIQVIRYIFGQFSYVQFLMWHFIVKIIVFFTNYALLTVKLIRDKCICKPNPSLKDNLLLPRTKTWSQMQKCSRDT